MTTLRPATPVLRFFDRATTLRFYVDWLGFGVDWEHGDDGPIYLQVSRGAAVLHLSSHHGDGTPGTVVLVDVEGIDDLHAELSGRDYPFFNPAVEEGPVGTREVSVLDPAGNCLRFLEHGPSPTA